MRQRLLYAGFGVLATIVGIAAGHLVAALIDPASSPVLAIGSTVIDLTPTPVKEWAVAQFGTADKPILVGSVHARRARARRDRRHAGPAPASRSAPACSWSWSPSPALAAVLRPTAGPLDVLPAIASRRGRRRRAVVAHPHAPPVATGAEARAEDGVAEPTRRPDRRRRARRGRRRDGRGRPLGHLAARRSVRRDAARPRPTRRPPFPQGLEGKVDGIASFRTPNDDFYRIDTRLTPAHARRRRLQADHRRRRREGADLHASTT